MKDKKEGIVIIDENTIYEIDTDCMGCKNYYQGNQERKKEWGQKKEQQWKSSKYKRKQ